MNVRTAEDQAAYEAFTESYAGICAFCDIAKREPTQVIETTDTMKVIQNVFPYASWDNFDVGDHRLIIPKRHIGNLESFSEQERSDYFDLLARYEALHYSIYSRAPSNTSRTVYHLHTHLIKPVGY
jgi:diadenosine tetraphosphate (Ap4A) HIT family hydrolase